MNLKDTITEDMKTTMRAKDSARLGTIRLLLAAIKQKEVDERVTLDDIAIIVIVDKMLKQRKDSITAFEQAGRQDLVAIEMSESLVLQAYLPARLSDKALASEVHAIVSQVGSDLGRALSSADMGKVMAAAKAQLQGKADMGQVSAAVKTAMVPRPG
jgi:uncharacterized protein